MPDPILAVTWVAAALVPTRALALILSCSADLIAFAALVGTPRFALAPVVKDAETSFGVDGASHQMMFASLAEPAMLPSAFTLALLVDTTQLSGIAAHALT